MKKFLSIILCFTMVLTIVNVPFTAYATDDGFFDDFQTGYTVNSSVGTSKWNTAINAKILQEGDNQFAAFYCEGEQYWPAMHKTVDMAVDKTKCFSGKVKLVSSNTAESQSFYLEYRSTNPWAAANRQNVLNLSSSSITISGNNANNYGSVVNDKWVEYNLYITPGAQGKATKIQAVINAVDENSLKDSSGNFVSTITAADEKVLDNIYVYQNNNANMVHNNNLKDTTSQAAMNYLDDVKIYDVDQSEFDNDLKSIKINGEQIAGFDKEKTQYSIVIPFESDTAQIEAEANTDKATVQISEASVSEFPKTVTITVVSKANLKKTYTINLKKKSSATEMAAFLTAAKDNKDAIVTMVYDDGHVNTAEFNQTMFEKYDLRGSSVIITNQMTGTKLTRMQAVVAKGRIDVTSHSTTHTKIDSSYNTDKILKMELVDSKDYLTTNFPTVDTLTFAPSNNTITDEGWEVVKQNYYAMRSGMRGYNTLSPEDGTENGQWYNLYMQGIGDVATVANRNAWIDNVISKKGWLIEMWHGIDEGGYQQQTKEDAQEHYKYISSKQDEGKIAVMTFNEATKYIRERQISTAAAYKIDDSSVGVDVTYDTSLLPTNIFDYPLTVKVEVPSGWGAVSITEDGKTNVKSTFVEEGTTYVYANVVPNSETCVITKVENSNKLSNIRINGSSMNNFDTDTNTYNIEIEASELPLKITAQKQDLNANVEIDNDTIASLPATCTIKVTDSKGAENTYTINITRAKATDAFLKSIIVDQKAIDGFLSNVLSYRVKTDSEDISVIKAVANDEEYASVSYIADGKTYTDESVSVKLPAIVTIIVKAEDGSEKKYSITIESNSGDIIYTADDFEDYEENALAGANHWDGTNFSSVTGVKAQKEDGNESNMVGYAFNVRGSFENQQLNKYLGAATSETVVIRGRYKGLSSDTTARADINVRGDGTNMVAVGDISNNGTIKVGTTTATFKYENGKWLNYIYVVKPGSSKYDVVGYFYGDGVGNNMYKLSGNSTNNSLADMTTSNCRILVRGNVNSGEGNGIYFDDIKIYSPGKFRILMDKTEDINIADEGKIYVLANHEIDASTFTKDSVTIKNSSDNSIAISEVVANANGFEVKFTTEVPDGEYTLSLNENAKDVAGQSVSNSVKFSVKNRAYSKIESLDISTSGVLNQPYDNLSKVKFTVSPTPNDNINLRQICWYVDGKVQDVNGLEFEFTPDECGKTYNVYAKAGDVSSKTITITVQSHPIVPISALSISTDGNLNQTINTISQINIKVSSTPSEYVNSSTIEWYVNGVNTSKTGADFAFTPEKLGAYAICAKVGDNVVSNTLTVNVLEKEIKADVQIVEPETFDYDLGYIVAGNGEDAGLETVTDGNNKYGKAWIKSTDQIQYYRDIKTIDYKSIYITGKYMYNAKDSSSFNLWLRNGSKWNKPFESSAKNGSVKVYGSSFTTLSPDKWVKFIVVLNPNSSDLTQSTARVIFSGDAVKNANYAISDIQTVDLTDIYKNNVRYMLQLYAAKSDNKEDGNLYLDDITLFNTTSFIAQTDNTSVTENSVKILFNHEVMPDTLKKENISVLDKDGNSVEIDSIEFDYSDLKYVIIKFKNKINTNETYKVSFGQDLKDIAGIWVDTTPVFMLSAAKPMAKLTINTNGTSVKADGSDIGESSTKEYVKGSSVALEAVGDGTFMYWKDTNSGAILSYDKEYTLSVGSDRNITAIFADDTGVYVTFKNANGIILAEGLKDSVKVPQNPYIYGYEFLGWYTDDGKTDLTAGGSVDADKNTVYTAGYTKAETEYTVTVDGAEGTYKYNDKVTVSASETKDGNTFSYWKRDGEVVSYNKDYSFYVSGNTELTSVYGESAEAKNVLVMATPVMVDSTRLAFFTERNIAKGNTVIESGVLIGNAANLTIDTALVKAVAKNTDNKGQYTVRKKNVSSGQTWYGRAYVIYKDASGNIYTIYSNEVTKTID